MAQQDNGILSQLANLGLIDPRMLQLAQLDPSLFSLGNAGGANQNALAQILGQGRGGGLFGPQGSVALPSQGYAPQEQLGFAPSGVGFLGGSPFEIDFTPDILRNTLGLVGNLLGAFYPKDKAEQNVAQKKATKVQEPLSAPERQLRKRVREREGRSEA